MSPRDALGITLYTIGMLPLLIGSAPVEEARGAPADDASRNRGQPLTGWLLEGRAGSIAGLGPIAVPVLVL